MKFTMLHYKYSDRILDLAAKKMQDGTPINLPIWWLDPKDKVAQEIDSGNKQPHFFNTRRDLHLLKCL